MPSPGQTKQRGLGMKKAKFQTLAEAIEAGEPSIADKITRELFGKLTKGFWVNYKGELLVIENAYKTLSGKYIIIAREKTQNEKEAQINTWQNERAEKIKTMRERIGGIMTIPGYILIAWGNPFQPDNNHFHRFFYPDTPAYYMPETGPRYVYQRRHKIIWEHDKMGVDSMTAKLASEKLSRWSRRKIADDLKKCPDDYILCAPLWLLTSIPESRPRFLAGKE
jgi:hypothetical protein